MKEFIGKKVIVRDHMAGVFFGIIKSIEGTQVYFEKARKLYYWKGANTVEDLALFGTKDPENCQFTCWNKNTLLANYCQILPCTKESANSIEGVPVWTAR